MSSHPRVYTRGASQGVVVSSQRPRVLAYGEKAQPWIEHELAGQPVFLQIARKLTDLVSALIHDPPPRPQYLVADFDAMSPGELLHMHRIREQGWFGCIIALSSVPTSLRVSLGIERVIRAPYLPHALRDIVLQPPQHAIPTLRVPNVSG